MRTLPSLVALILLVGAPLSVAQAQSSTGFALDRFRPAPTTEDGIALSLPRTLGHLRAGASLTLDYAHQPLVLSEKDQSADGAIVKHRFVGHVVAALGLGERFEVFVHAPILLTQKGDDPSLAGISFPNPKDVAFGDLSLGGSVRLLGEDLSPFQLGIQAAITLPSGNDQGLSGDDGVGADARLSAAYHVDDWTFAGNLGGRYRPTADYGTAALGSELLFGLGAYYRITEKVTAMGEWYGATSFRDSQAFKSRGTPSELLFGARWTTPIKLVLTGAIGAGLTQAVGVPDMRALLSLGFPPPRPPLAPPDRDHDGIVDDQDRCPDLPEDFDDFQDDDGCPDPDNDRDGIADVNDACPMHAEDIDGFEDEDGCPELDNDKDGIDDDKDQCPNDAEDKDGISDEDGCPETDHDGDGVLDAEDKCPNEKGPADNNGCPSGDKDGDGVPDHLDRCPDDKGSPDNGGCIDTDRDGDGVVDRLDKCPDEKGPAFNGGCALPDTDKDGTPDEYDNCPGESGPADNSGCPAAKKQLVQLTEEKLIIKDKVYFDTGKATLQAKSNKLLDQIAEVLQSHPGVKLVNVEGHTDNSGSAETNRTLSAGRAQAVVDYLVKKGVEAGRLKADGVGPDQPVADNGTPAGREQNRRVEFKVTR